MGRTILYGKIGRSMPLTLDKCGTLGGDVEQVAVVKTLALRNPDDFFILIGRNSGETAEEAGLPSNVFNPWPEWGPALKRDLKDAGLKGNFSVWDQQRYAEIVDRYTLPTFRRADAIVMWVGQHGTSNMPLPKIDDRTEYTKPQDSFVHYASFIFRGINAWRDVDPWTREEIYLNADARNYLKMRDLKWPLRHPVLTQFKWSHRLKHERFGDGIDFEEWSGHDLCTIDEPRHRDQVWVSKVHNVYSRLEINGLLPDTPFGDLIHFNGEWSGRGSFGLFINEARHIGILESRTRRAALSDWVLPLNPDFIHGTWSEESQKMLGRTITAAPWNRYFPKLHSVRSTFTTPSSGSAWATTKPWEAFAAGTVCFFHPLYDSQNNILGDTPVELRDFLRVRTPKELADRVELLNRDEAWWRWIVFQQKLHFDRAVNELTYVKMIESRINGEVSA